MNAKTKSLILHTAIAVLLLGGDGAVTAISHAIVGGSIALPATTVALVLAGLGFAHTEIQHEEVAQNVTPPSGLVIPNPPPLVTTTATKLVLK